MDDNDTTELPAGDAQFLRDISRLADMSTKLSEEIPRLSDSVRKKMRFIAAGFVMFALALSVGAYNVYWNHRNGQLFRDTITKSLCPIDKIFVDALTPALREAQPPDKRAYYDKAAKAIDDAYAFLKCPTEPGAP